MSSITVKIICFYLPLEVSGALRTIKYLGGGFLKIRLDVQQNLFTKFIVNNFSIK